MLKFLTQSLVNELLDPVFGLTSLALVSRAHKGFFLISAASTKPEYITPGMSCNVTHKTLLSPMGTGGVRIKDGVVYTASLGASISYDMATKEVNHLNDQGFKLKMLNDAHQIDVSEGIPYYNKTASNTINKVSDDSVYWEPSWTDKRCDTSHINGMRFDTDGSLVITMLGKGVEPNGWRGNFDAGRLCYANDVDTFLPVCIPHSPVVTPTALYVIESGKSRVVKCSRTFTGAEVVVDQLPGFVRGMALVGDTLVIGSSSLRESSSFLDALGAHGTLVDSPTGITLFKISTGERKFVQLPIHLVTQISDLDAI